MRFDNQKYVRSHGKNPKGKGLWFFEVHLRNCEGVREEMVNGTLTEAKAEVKRRHPAAVLAYVMP